MLGCEPIVGLKLDKESLEAIERIEEKVKVAQLLGAAATAGVFNSIFTKSRPPVIGYNISQADWGLYAQAMSVVPVITKSKIQDEIKLMLVHYYMPGNYDHKHVKFWQGLKNGCK